MGGISNSISSIISLLIFCMVSNTVCSIPIAIITTIFPALEPIFKVPSEIIPNLIGGINNLSVSK